MKRKRHPLAWAVRLACGFPAAWAAGSGRNFEFRVVSRQAGLLGQAKAMRIE